MKQIRFILMTVILAVLVACGGEKSYDPGKCEQLKSKIEKNEEFTESDYNDMIDQMTAIAKELDGKSENVKDDKEKTKELFKDKEVTEKVGYCLGFVFYLSMHEKDLSESNLKRLKEAEADMEAFK